MNLLNILRALKEWIFKLLGQRLTYFFLVYLLLFGGMWAGAYHLQITEHDEYERLYESAGNPGEEERMTRGEIFDRYGRPLAVNRMETDLYYVPASENDRLNEALLKLIDIADECGVSLRTEVIFPLRLLKNHVVFLDSYTYTNNPIAHDNFVAEALGSSRDALTDEEKNLSPTEVYQHLLKEVFHISEEMQLSIGREKSFLLASLRYAIYSGRFDTEAPVLLARGLPEKAVARIIERSTLFSGFQTRSSANRYYPEGELFAHILGYVGRADETMLLEGEVRPEDEVGRAGLELSLEETLRNGTENGRIFLTIDRDLQEAAYRILYDQLRSLMISKLTGESSEKGLTYRAADVMTALLDNGFFTREGLKESGEETALQIVLETKETIETVSDELQDIWLHTDTPIQNFGPIQKELYDIIITDMRERGDLSYEYQQDEAFYPSYAEGLLSARQFLVYCLEENLIRLSSYGLDGESRSQEDKIEQIVRAEMESLKTSLEAEDALFRFMIQKEYFSARTMLTLCFTLDYIRSEKVENAFLSYELSAEEALVALLEEDALTVDQIGLDPCSGSVVITDPGSGQVLAMVSYPSFDPNRFMYDEAYSLEILSSRQGPMLFRALEETRAIGSTYKMVTAIAGLEEGVITPEEKIYDAYAYENANSPEKPHCWSLVSHGEINVAEALEHSCNYYFYEVGYRLSEPNEKKEFRDATGLQKLAGYAEILGLSTPTGIELPEAMPYSSDLDSVRSAIGQGTNAFSAANLNRYTCTIANEGTVYDLYLVDTIESGHGEILYQASAEPRSESGIDPSVFLHIKEGMKNVIQKEVKDLFRKTDAAQLDAAGKTGTAQEREDRPDHSLFTGFYPIAQPKIAVTVIIPYGDGSMNAIPVFEELLLLTQN